MTLNEKRLLIADKVQILKDFHILPRKDRKTKSAVISVLAECKTELEMERCLYNVMHGNETLAQLLQRKGEIVC